MPPFSKKLSDEGAAIMSFKLVSRGVFDEEGTLKRVARYFEEDGVILLKGWHGTLKRVVWYFEECAAIMFFKLVSSGVFDEEGTNKHVT